MIFFSKNRYELLQFNDNLLRLIGIPFLGLFIPIAFYDFNPFENAIATFITLVTGSIISAVLWQVNRFIVLFFRSRMEEKRNSRRLLLTILLATLFVLIFTFGQNLIALYFQGEYKQQVPEDFIKRQYFSNLLITYLLIIIYETVYSIRKWKSAVVDAESYKSAYLEAQVSALKSTISPHFLFNSLNTLSSLVKEDADKSEDFIKNLATVYRHVLELKDEKLIPLSQELVCVQSYLELLERRFGDKLRVKIQIEKIWMDYLIVPLSVQMLVENAIKHNIVATEKPLLIEINSTDGHLIIQNKLQPKRTNYSGGFGHNNIIKQYKELVNKDVIIEKSADSYCVSLPLISHSEYSV